MCLHARAHVFGGVGSVMILKLRTMILKVFFCFDCLFGVKEYLKYHLFAQVLFKELFVILHTVYISILSFSPVNTLCYAGSPISY